MVLNLVMSERCMAGPHHFALINAAKEGNVAVVRDLLQRKDVQNEVNLAYLEAASKNHRECLALLQNHCHAEYLERILTEKSTTLAYTAQHGNLWDLRLQILSDVNVDAKSGPCHKTALMYAAQFNHPHCVLDLISCGAHIDEQDASKQTALFYAAKSGSMDALEMLIQEKANTQIKSKDGQVAEFYLTPNNALKYQQLVSDYQEYGNITKLIGVVPKLQHLARSRIRLHLVTVHKINGELKELVSLVKRLPIPTCTQHYLLFLSM